MAKKFLITYAYSIYNCYGTRVLALGYGGKVVELEVLPQNDEELNALGKSLLTSNDPLRRIIAISPLS